MEDFLSEAIRPYIFPLLPLLPPLPSSSEETEQQDRPLPLQNSIQLLWEGFVTAESKSHEKAIWFDTFLAEFLAEVKEGKSVKDILSSSVAHCGSVSTLVACELLSDVHSLCNVPDEGEELSTMRQHLLTSRGWRCLAVLQCLGLQEVSCGWELARLLISLYSVGGDNDSGELLNPYLVPATAGGEVQCRPHLLRRQSRSLSNPEPTPPRRSSLRVPRAVTAPDLGKAQESSESDDPELGEAHQIRSALKIRFNPMDFDYFTTVVRSDDEAAVNTASHNPVQRKMASSKLNPEDFIDDRIKDVMKHEINSYEFKILVIELLHGLVKSENIGQQISSNHPLVCLQTMSFCLETLCPLQFGSDANSKKMSRLKCLLSRLLLSSLDKVLIQPEITHSILQKGILPVMLQLSEDILRKHSPDTVKNLDDEESHMVNEYIYSVIYAVIMVVHCLLSHNSSTDKLDQFLTLFNQFGNSLNGRLVDKTVTVILSFTQVSTKKCAERAKNLILLVSQLITALKKTRTKIVHARQCKRNKHKMCMIKAAMHHHDNTFGCVYVGSILQPATQQNCSVSALFMTLTKFISDNTDRDIVIRTLQLMSACGTCCCFPALVLLKKIIKLILCTDNRVRNCGLVLLEKTFYRQMGAFEENANCDLCARNSFVENLDESSKSSSSDLIPTQTKLTIDNKPSKWNCLGLFKDLLLSSDPKVTLLVGTHLLRIIPQCKAVVKQEILFSVFYPAFLKMREQVSEHHSESDKFLIITCLSVFTNLLRRVKIVDQFLEQKAMHHVMDMLHDKDTMKLSCSILEIVIITQVWKAEKSYYKNDQLSNNIFYMSSVNLPEFDFLLEEIRLSSTKCLSMVHSKGNEADLEHLGLADSIVCSEDQLVFYSSQCYQLYSQLLDSLQCLWRTLANLSLFSPQVRQSIQERTTTVLAQKLLIALLQRLNKSTLIKGEPSQEKESCIGQLHLKLIEPLLVLCVVCPPADDNPETFVSCEQLMRQLKPLLSCGLGCATVTIRQLCDVLYRVSLAQPSTRLVIPTHKMPKVGSLSWEGAVLTLSPANAYTGGVPLELEDTVSDCDTSPNLTADDGYEADVEIRDHLSEQTEEQSVGASSRQASVDWRKPAKIIHPELCILAIDLVADFVQSGNLSDSQLLDCVYCLQRLSREDCHLLVHHRMVSRLLSQFSDVLSTSEPKFAELQRAVLDLVSLLARHTVEPHELTQYLRFFTLNNPPLESLLPPLVGMVSNSEVQPSSALRFPVPSGDWVSAHSQASPAEKTAVAMRKQHIAAGIESSWSCSGLALPINTDLGWSMWVNGFSVSFWLRLHPSPASTSSQALDTDCPTDLLCSDTSLSETWCTENETLPHSSDNSQASPPVKPHSGTAKHSLIHLVSVGFDVMVLEVWLNVSSGALVFRLVRPDGKRQELLCEATVASQLSTNHWHNLAINVRDSVQKRKVVIEVLLLVDGCVSVQVPLVFTGLLIRKARPSCLLLGHCGQADSCYLLSSVLMFRAPVFNKENATSLVAHGPDYIHLTQADVGNIKPNLSTVFRERAILAGVNWESVFHEQTASLRVLQENLLLSYSAENYKTVNAYPQAISNSAGVVGSLFPPTPGFRVATVDTRASQLLPMSIRPIFFAPACDQHYHGITVAADTIGGISVFLFLFARVVELKGSEESQAQALFVLLKLAQSSCELNSQFESRDVPRMLCHVLASPRCSPSLYMLKMILDVCCDRPGLISAAGAVSTLVPAVVTEPGLLAGTVVRAWRQWAHSPTALLTLLQALQALLRDDHPYREFNAAQLNRAHLLHSLLHICKEVFLSGEQSVCLESRVCGCLVDLVRSLMGAPPELPHIVAIYDYLVLAHPAHATYITTLRPSFYFLVNTSASSHASSNHSDADSTVGTVRKSKSMFSNINESAEPTTRRHLTQPVDPTKLNKALANLQIKQLGQQQLKTTLSASLDTNRSDIFTSSGQGSMDEFSSDDKLNSSLSDPVYLELSPPPPPATGTVLDDEKEMAELKSEDLNKIDSVKCDPIKSTEGVSSVPVESAAVVTEGLLLLLRDVMLVLPDSMVHQVLSQVIRPETLLVMANHQAPQVRTAVIKVLSAYTQRASEEEVSRLVRLRGYYQLANQLGQWPASPELVEGVVAMVTAQHWLPLEEQLQGEVGVTSLQPAALPPLLALLPCCTHSLPLTHHLLHFLQRLFTKVAQGQRALMDCGLIETLCKTIVVISHTPSQPTDLCDVNDRDILLADIQSFLLTIVAHGIHSPGNHNMQVLTDMLVVLRYLERVEAAHPQCVSSLRAMQCAVLSSTVQLIQDKITSQQTTASRIRSTASAILSSVLSPGYDEIVELRDSLMTTSKSSSNSDSVNSLSSSNTNLTLGRPNKVPRSEINDRFKMIITKATEFFIYSDCSFLMSACEVTFACHLFSLLLSGMAAIVERRSGSRNTWTTVVWNCRDTVRAMTGQLMVWMMSPGQTNKMRMFVVQSLRNQLKAKDVISSIILSNNQIEQQYALYLWQLMYGADSSSLLAVEKQVCEELKGLLQAWGVYSPQAIGHDYDPWTDDLTTMARTIYTQRQVWTKHQEPIVNRTIGRMEPVVKAVSEAAKTVTEAVVTAQNLELKALMESMKQTLSDSIHAQIQWKMLAHQLTHERAVWHFPNSYPRSWQLDETEGPARVRKRLKRCHLNINKRFLKPEFQDKLDAASQPQPLSFLFGVEGPSMSAVLIERLHMDEKIRHMASARIVTPAHEVSGELLIGETSLYFVPSSDPSKIDVNSGPLDICSQAWQFEEVKEIHNRRFQLQERALEIFLLNGKTYLLAFESLMERDTFALELSQCELPHRVASDHLSDTVQLWREGHLTNWEYLVTLNKMAGRSYNDLMQYPVMPFVLADYTSATLDLSDPKSYRNFKKPMAVQEKSSEQHYINNYNYLKQELTDALNLISINQEAYHYSSHYSNSGTVLHFLVRLPPFTCMFINYQDNNFDLPDRTFHSLHTTWRLTSSESPTDVKELIPEFFCLPEFLGNHEGFDFGIRQNGAKVDEVALPPWACGDPRRFTLVHRQALESDYVREHLPHWIDLVFGYKQTGKAAVESINVFHPATYYGFNPEAIVDPLERIAWETMVKTYGQTPRQLFRAAHPMVVQSLAPKTTSLSTTHGAKGISWGNYVGSPSDSPPSVIWQQQHRTPVASLIPLLTNDVFGLAPSTALLLAYSKEKTLSLVAAGGTCVLGAALVSWGHPDGIVRAKLRKEQPPYPAIRPPRCGGPVTHCISVPDCNQLWLGYTCGKILVYRYKFKPSKGTLEFSPEPVELVGHNAPILSLTLSRAYSVALSGCRDGSAILWDINRLSYVRSLPNISLPVSLTCVSEVSGELVTVGSDWDSGCCTVRLHTINLALVGSVTTREQITAVCFSTAPEGLSINVIATGMANGVIRLWSTWDLTAVGEIEVNSIDHPVIGLTYSHDSQHLYASTDNGNVIIWEGSAAKGGSKTPKFLNLTTLM